MSIILILICSVITVLALFKIFNKKDFNITFDPNGGTLLTSAQTVENGSQIKEPAEPTKEGYTFKGWYNGDTKYNFSKKVDKDIKLTAKWEKNKYTVTFKDEVGGILETKTVEYGEIPNYTGQELIKVSSKKFTYTFAGWSPNITEVKEDITYTATYTKTINSYKVSFIDQDGLTLSKTQNVEYEKEAIEPTQPVKKGHKFLGWYSGNTKYDFTQKVDKDIKLTAKWEKNKYTITFVDENGELLETKTVKYGEKPTYTGKTPEKAANNKCTYTFAGWTPSVTEVKGNETYKATYAEKNIEYEIKFVDENGIEISKQAYCYGDIVKLPANPEKAPDAKYTYTFVGWSPNVIIVQENATYTAMYTETINKYEVKFVEEDGTTLTEKQKIEYGNKAIEPKEPTKEGYKFIGWYNGETKYTFAEEVKSNITLTAKWEKNKYTIKFVNEDGTILETKTVEYGVVPTYTGKTPEKAANEKYTYTFAGWTPSITEVKGNATYTAIYTENYREYEIKFVDEDGTEISKKTYHYGDTVEIPETPEKAADEKYTYTFAGWSPSVTEVKGNATYTATYTEKYREYEIKFVDENGTEISKKTYHYGDTVEIPENPEKAADEKYTYTFAGWSPSVTEVKENATYTATYTEKYIEYEIKFVDEDGTEISKKTYHYGDKVEIPENPEKAADEKYTYTFAGWTPSVTEVKGNATYTATYTEKYREYEIKFVDEDGTEISKKTYHYGDTVEIPENPEKAADEKYTYTFAGWTPSVTEVKGNATYTATYTKTINKYEISFINEDGTILETKTVEYGVVPTYTGKTPEKAADEKYTYTFAGWSPSVTEVKGNTTYIAIYTKIINKYEVSFINEDGTILETKTVEYGVVPTYTGKTPEKAANEKYTYTFAGWSPNVTEVKENATYTATYTENYIEYEIKFVNADGTEISKKTYHYGDKVEIPETPEKAADEKYTYTFAGWTPSVTEVKGNATYTATYTKTIKSYEVTFIDEDGTTLSETQKIEYGNKATEPEKPVKEGHNFLGWYNGETKYTFTEEVKTNITLRARWEKNKYTIKFVNEDGTILETKTVEYGAIPTYTGKTPEKAANEKFTYIFAGWTPNVTEVKGNATYTAIYTENYREYEIKFVNADGTEISKKTYHYGDMVEIPEDPEKAADEKYTYTFAGWSPSITEVKGNATYTATYTENYIEYEIKFVDEDGTEISKKTYHYGDKVEIPENPEKAADEKYTYTFAGWTPSVTEVKGNTIYTATYKRTINSYEVIFIDEDGTTLAETQKIEYGNKATRPTEPEKEGYKFIGWYNGETKYTFTEEVKTNITLKARWEKNKYTIKFVNEDGTILETKTVEYGVVPTYTGKTPEKAADEKYTYTFAGWTPSVTEAKSNTTYTATYTKTIKSYEVTFIDEDGTTLSETQKIEYGNKATEPEKPVKEGHNFLGWYNGEAKYTFTEEVKTNITLKAKWEKNKYTIKFVNEDGTVLETKTVEYGVVPTYTGKTPEKAADGKYAYIFVGWNPIITEAKANATYTAVFKYFIDVDKNIEDALSKISETIAKKFTVSKTERTLNAKFAEPDSVINMFYEIVQLFDAVSCNDSYEAFELYYKHPGHSNGQTIDLTDYNLKDTSLGSWYGNGANDRVGDWLGYLASGTASTMAAFNAHTDDLIGKTVNITIKLKDGYALKDGSTSMQYDLNFIE